MHYNCNVFTSKLLIWIDCNSVTPMQIIHRLESDALSSLLSFSCASAVLPLWLLHCIVLSVHANGQMWLRAQSWAMDCTMELELCSGQIVMTVHCQGSDEERRGCYRAVGSSERPASPLQTLCAAPPPLTRWEAVWHFLWVCDATSAYFLPLVIPYLFSLSLIPPFHQPF